MTIYCPFGLYPLLWKYQGNGMKERVLAIRKVLKLSQEEFAQRLGMKRTTLSMIEVGDNALTEKNVRLICMIFNVDENWLRTGKGEMFAASPYEKEFFEIYGSLLPETQKALLKLAKDLLATQKKYPVYGSNNAR
jgi:transcriptional regulator with XRE-family HTH domain